jgi:hypothetical protein
MAEFDYAAWIARALAFAERLKPSSEARVDSSVVAAPAAEGEVVAVETALGARLPSSLRAFFTRGAAGLDCKYVVEPTAEALDRLLELRRIRRASTVVRELVRCRICRICRSVPPHGPGRRGLPKRRASG